MDSSNFHSIPFLFIIVCFIQLLQPTASDYQTLVYSHCPNQTSQNLTHSTLLDTLFEQFSAHAHSTRSKFFKTIVGDENVAISGSFQCRNDLSTEDCKNCVSKFPDISRKSCGQTVPARIQLLGCYAHYQEDWAYAEPEPSYGVDQILHKKCSKHRVKKELQEIMFAALSELPVSVIYGEGFCEMTDESMYVMAQCNGNLGFCDCGECVGNAVQFVEEDCRYSVSGEIYLDRCFISYKYYGGNGFGGDSFEEDGLGNRSPKLVAIVVGAGLAALFLGFGLCYFIRSCGEKNDDW